MTDYLPTPELAKHIRTTLRARFRACRFSVRSNSYSGGSSIDIHWTDGPTRGLVESIVKGWEGSSFDGMIDLKSSRHVDLLGKRILTDYIFCTRKLSAPFMSKLVEAVGTHYHAPRETWPLVVVDQYDPRLGPRADTDSPLGNAQGSPHWCWSALVRRASENRLEVDA